MDNEGVKEIERIVKAGQQALSPIKIGDSEYTAQALARIPEFHPLPGTREFLTLTGLAGLLIENPDKIPAGAFIHVLDFNAVEIVGPPEGEALKSAVYAKAKSPVSQDFPFDRFMPVEEMVIKVRSLFAPNDELAEVVSMLVNVDSTKSVSQDDDGVGQAITVKVGGSGAIREPKLNRGIFKLKPFRTFQEIDQPEGEFLFRIKTDTEKGASAALFSAGGNAWRLLAIARIKDYLTTTLGGKFTVLG